MAKVGADRLTVHITADDMRPAFEEIRMMLDAHSHEVDTLREQIAAVRDGLDAWAARIQRLESLPGVQEALTAMQEESEDE